MNRLFGQILTGQTGGQQYSDISPYKVSECSLPKLVFSGFTFKATMAIILPLESLNSNVFVAFLKKSASFKYPRGNVKWMC